MNNIVVVSLDKDLDSDDARAQHDRAEAYREARYFDWLLDRGGNWGGPVWSLIKPAKPAKPARRRRLRQRRMTIAV